MINKLYMFTFMVRCLIVSAQFYNGRFYPFNMLITAPSAPPPATQKFVKTGWVELPVDHFNRSDINKWRNVCIIL